MGRRRQLCCLRGPCWRYARASAAGFTLVELVTVMVVLGILAVGAVRFIGDSSSGFAATVTRTQLAGDTRFAAERIAREVRNALPGSVRVSGSCLEFVPVVAASRYVTLPVAAAAVQFRSAPPEPLPLPAGARVAVYPDTAVYSLGASAAISPVVSASAPGADNQVVMTFAAAHRFPKGSPFSRYFVVTDPISYCADGGALYRYANYGFIDRQPTPSDLPAALPGRALVAEHVSSIEPFRIGEATLTRNAVVRMDLVFSRGGDEVRLEHAVQVRNVP